MFGSDWSTLVLVKVGSEPRLLLADQQLKLTGVSVTSWHATGEATNFANPGWL